MIFKKGCGIISHVMTISYKGAVVVGQRQVRVKQLINPGDYYAEHTRKLKITMTPDPDQFTDKRDPNKDKVTVAAQEGRVIYEAANAAWTERTFVGEEIRSDEFTKLGLGIGWYGDPNERKAESYYSWDYNRRRR